MCKDCKENPVIRLTNSNISLCKKCFERYFEKKAFKTIRQFNLIDKKDSIVVAVSGGKDSLSTLNILNKLASTQRDLKLTAILIDEGIKGYRDKTIRTAKEYCKKNKINLKIYSFKEEFGYSLDEMIKKLNEKPCTVCGVLRRQLLNKKARLLKATKLATGHNLDDETQSILMNQFRRNIETSARLGPITGVLRTKAFIPRIKPLYFLTEKEAMTYAFLKNLNTEFVECPYSSDSYRADVRDWINSFEEKYPGTKHSILTAFLEILPLLKEKYKTIDKIKHCKICKEPCSQEICTACSFLEKLR